MTNTGKSRESLVLEALRGYKYGLTSFQIVALTGMSLRSVRFCLQGLRQEGKVHWYADWYGKNAGYARRYTLEEMISVVRR